MRSIKFQFFLGYAVLGSVGPYIPVYLGWRGLADDQIGWLMSLGGVSALMMPGIMTLLADLKLENRTLLRGVFLVGATALGMMLATTGLWWLIPAFLIWALAISPLMSLCDGLLFSVRGIREAAGESTPPYHQIRVFGTLGFIIPSFILFWLMRDPDPSVIRLSLACGLVIALIAAANTFTLPHTRAAFGQPGPTSEVPDPHPPAKIAKALPTKLALKRMLQPDLALFLFTMLLMHTATASLYTFYPLYLTRITHVKEEWLGLISSVGVSVEVGFVLAFGWMLKKLGLRWLLVLGIATIVLRMALLWLVPTLTVAVGTQLLHGMNVLILFILPPLYLNHRSESAFRNSMQGLYATLILAVGRMIGNILAGQTSRIFDGDLRMIFALMTAVSAVGLLLQLLFFRDKSGDTIEP